LDPGEGAVAAMKSSIFQIRERFGEQGNEDESPDGEGEASDSGKHDQEDSTIN